MKKNFYYLSLILGFFFGMMTFTACGGSDGDDDGDGGNGQTTNNNGGGSSTPQEDYGSDGLKGYWVQNVWQEIDFEHWYYTYSTNIIGIYDKSEEKVTGQYSRLIYLDGEGGGTMYHKVTTLDHAANNQKYLLGKIGTFFDTVDGTTKDYHFFKTYSHNISNFYTPYDNEYEFTSSGPLEYFIKGTTMTIYYDNVTSSIQLNVSSGYVTGYHRLKAVN